MVLGKVHINDTYTDFQILVTETDVTGTNAAFNLGLESVLQMVFKDPDDTETTVTGVILNGAGTDGIMRFINSAGTLVIDKTGLWRYRAKLTLTTGGYFQSNEATFEVL